MLLLSVPPDVNTISWGPHPRSAATSSRAPMTPFFALWPNEWELEGLPKCSSIKGNMAVIASAATGVVPL